MNASRPPLQVLNGVSLEPHPHHRNEDVCVDMHYAKHDCKDPLLFAAEPWKYCKDSANTYLGLRFEKRAHFKSKLTPKELKRVEHEELRIKQTRANFSSYPRKKEMMLELREARKAWKIEVTNKLENYGQQEQPLYPKTWVRDQAIDRALIERVKSWPVDDVIDESTIAPHLEAEYGFKACAIYFKKSDTGWDRHTHKNGHLLPGKFPNQKIPVHNILEKKEGNPLSEKCPPNQLRYFHFPTNNMLWIEKAMARYYDEEVGDHNEAKSLSEMSKAEKLLNREFWRGQLHGGDTGNGPVHARHMRSRCSVIPMDSDSGSFIQPNLAPKDPASSQARDHLFGQKARKNFAIFLPYLHWETDVRRARMAAVIKEEIKERKAQTAKRRPDEAQKRTLIDILKDKVAKKHRHLKIFEEKEKTKLGRYLFALAQVADAMDYEADERLLRENLHLDPPLHIRRTLDQSYFLTLEDTGIRDKDQVVYRETRAGRSFHSHNTRVVMVDQLWLWILDGNTIITSFPRRWGRNKPDPSGVHKSLREKLANIPDGQIQSVYDLALIIIDQCSRVFFDRTKPLDQRPEVMDLFASAIGNLTEHTTIAYESFWRNMELRALNPTPYGTGNSNHKYLDINPEGTLLREAQDIAEELQIMLRIYNQQLQVVKDLRKTLGHMNGESKNEPDDVRNLLKLMEYWQNQKIDASNTLPVLPKGVVPEHTIQEANDVLEHIRNRKSEIQDLEDAALRTSHQLQGLLSLKQQQASIIEAKAALKRADESVKQGRAIMAFTLVTIFFLPLGFFAAFFGMNNLEINGASWMNLAEQIQYMFGLSAAVIAVALSMAFSPWTRATLTVLVKVPLAFIAEYSGLRAVWRENIVDHVTLERKGQQKLEYIYKRQDRLKEARKKKEQEDAKRLKFGPDQNMARNLVTSFHNSGVESRILGEKMV